ncbi:hypothetical protein ACNOYE_35925 [Nannocystaceae bacterium ST9]
MALNWIVPARRLVIASERQTYADVLEGWIEQLRRHRDKLLEWYTPLVEGRDLGTGFDRSVDAIERWKDWFLAGSASEAGHAIVTGGSQTLDSLDFRVRLWKGPLRVLKEEAAAAAAPPPEPPPPGTRPRRPPHPPDPPPPTLTTIDLGGPLPLLLDGVQRVVINPDAVFLPGDVIELAIFRLWWLAGISRFEGGRFNRDAAPFHGTTVLDRAGSAADAIVLHDNLLAMRFQELVGIAVGGFPSLESGWVAGSDNQRRALSHSIESTTVHARGIIYGGALGDVSSGDRFDFRTMTWGTLHVPTRGSLEQFAAGTKLTTGWACSPCALALAATMCNETGSWRGGSIGSNSRSETGAPYICDNSEYDYFAPALPGGRAAQATTLTTLWTRRGLSEPASIEGLRSLAFGRMFGNPASVAGEPVRFDHAAVLPTTHDVTRSAAQMLEYLDGAAWAELSLNGHEYSWVPVHAHAELLDEPVFESARGRIPPRVGSIAAYDPIDGTSYVAEGSGPDLYVFEATGSFHPTNLGNLTEGHPPAGTAQNFTVFEVRPFRWKKVEQVNWRREVTISGRGEERREVDSKIKVGEGIPVCGETTRGKELMSIARFSAERVRALHAQIVTPERDGRPASARLPTFVPICLLSNLANSLPFVRERAVGSPTMSETASMAGFFDLATAEATRVADAEVLARALVRIARLRAAVPDFPADDRQWLTTSSPGFDRRVTNSTTQLQSEAELGSRTREGRIRSLRTRLAGTYPPDPGRDADQPVEERASFRTALEHASPTDRRLRNERSLRDTAREHADTPDPATLNWPHEAMRHELDALRDYLRRIHTLLVDASAD